MTSKDNDSPERHIRSIQRAVLNLESAIQKLQQDNTSGRLSAPRSELLEQIYTLGVVEQRRLFKMLDQRDINHTWIGAQVGSNNLDMWHSPDGRTFYRATDRAVRDLQLGQLASVAIYASLSQSAFFDDWQCEGDASYDRL